MAEEGGKGGRCERSLSAQRLTLWSAHDVFSEEGGRNGGKKVGKIGRPKTNPLNTLRSLYLFDVGCS